MHPLRIGALYGLIAAVFEVVTVQINHTVVHGNGFVGFIGAFLAPLIVLYLAGHFAGRHERMQLQTTVVSGLRSTLHGTGSGIVSGLVFIILVGLASKFLGQYLPYNPNQSGDTWGSVLGGIGYIGGFIGWPFVGIILGTIGGALGDNMAHNELKKAAGATPPAAR